MSVAGLFAGVGGFELAFSQVGFETRLLVEIEPSARAVLKAQFTTADIRSDVADLDDLPAGTTIVTAGFPCQNLSMAGDKSGITGPKSGVVVKMFDLIRQSKTPLVVIENVYFMLELDSGKAMQWLVERFEELGYRWAYRVLDTMGFGLPQRRRRVYFVASTDLDPRSILFADDLPASSSEKLDLARPIGFYWTEGRSGVGFTVDGIPPLKVGSSVGILSVPAVLFPDGELLLPNLTACERLQGFPAGWTDSAADNGKGRRVEWKMVGNAVSVPVARWVAERIKAPGAVLDFEEGPLAEHRGRRWPDAAWNIGQGRVRVSASDKPIAVAKPSISQFRDSSWTRLSDRALDGFIDRASNGRIRMPEGFLTAVRSAPRKTISRIRTGG
jgi:DNA (cytosine-5)-methyltransferase 1